mmetsp:Transcript_53942/g.161452  ORF Transcript_53942/g.161452 Transcript_53942/m.161452 type:complete len:358 (-) Transcript_53942:46-1119(-)
MSTSNEDALADIDALLNRISIKSDKAASRAALAERLRLAFRVRVLMKMLEKEDQNLRSQAVQTLRYCSQMHKAGRPGYQSLSASICKVLPVIVGEKRWQKSDYCCKIILQKSKAQKKKSAELQKSTSQAVQPPLNSSLPRIRTKSSQELKPDHVGLLFKHNMNQHVHATGEQVKVTTVPKLYSKQHTKEQAQEQPNISLRIIRQQGQEKEQPRHCLNVQQKVEEHTNNQYHLKCPVINGFTQRSSQSREYIRGFTRSFHAQTEQQSLTQVQTSQRTALSGQQSNFMQASPRHSMENISYNPSGIQQQEQAVATNQQNNSAVVQRNNLEGIPTTFRAVAMERTRFSWPWDSGSSSNVQ